MVAQVGHGIERLLAIPPAPICVMSKQGTHQCRLTLIIACIIYWQAKEIKRVLLEEDPEGVRMNLSLLEHISSIGWENVILYGEYVLNRNLVRT
jgi:Tn3 transposase DDE domain